MEGRGEEGVTLQICHGRGKGSPPNMGREPYEATHGAAREEDCGTRVSGRLYDVVALHFDVGLVFL